MFKSLAVALALKVKSLALALLIVALTPSLVYATGERYLNLW